MSVDETTIPEWLGTMFDQYRAAAANVFILHGNVFDYVEHPETDLTVAEYLADRLRYWSVVNFSPDSGLTFPGIASDSKRTRKRFEQLTGIAPGGLSDSEALLYGDSASGAPPASADLPSAASQALPLIIEYLSRTEGRVEERNGGEVLVERGLAIVERLDLICPPADKGTMPENGRALLALLHRAGTLRAINRIGSMMVLLAPTLAEVHPDLLMASSGIRAISVPPPDYGERMVYANRIIERTGLRVEGSTAELVAQTAGLPRRAIEDISLRAQATATTLPDGTVDDPGVISRALVRERKAELMAAEYGDVLEIMEPDISFDMIGGHDLAKQYVNDWIISLLQSEDEALRALIPLGVALLGPAGTGKTIFAKAVAQATGINCVALRAEKLKGQYVGQSEQRLAKAIIGMKALAPCIVFVDEIDQRFRRSESGGGDGGSAVEANQFSSLLEFFGDGSHRGQILVLAATNRPDLVDAALFRSGRFDTKIPLLPPDTTEERRSVLMASLRRKGVAEYDAATSDAATSDAAKTVASDTDGWTQAELERLAFMAVAISRVQKVSLAAALLAARGRMKPSTREIQRMTVLALRECDDLSLVPPRWQKILASEQAAAGEPSTAVAAREAAPVGRRAPGFDV